MDCEIIFRGKRLEIGPFASEKVCEWVYGGYAKDCSGTYIYDTTRASRMVRVDPNTVGRYIGVKDKNGAMIFEGDVIRCLEKHMKGQCFEVWWSKGCCGFSAGRGIRTRPNLNQATVLHYEIAGNIHDNPELAEVRDGKTD